jgi:hypothetical protein
LDNLKREAAASATPMQKLGTTMRGMVGPAFAMAGAAVAAFAVKLAVDGVQAAMEEQKQLAILKQTLDNVGQAFAMDEVNTFIDDLRFATGVADDELRPAFQKLVGATKDAELAQRLLAVAVDTSVGSGKDLSSVSMAMAKAVAGSSTALKRLVPELDATAIAGGGADKVISVLSARFGGSAQAAASTFAGQLQRIQDGFQELTEAFGTGFIDQLDGAEDSADTLAQSLRDLQPVVEQLGASFGGIGKTISDNGDLINYVATSISAQLNMVSAAIDGVGIAWDAVTGIVTGSWPFDETEGAAKSANQMALEFENSGKGAAIMAEMVGDKAAPAVYRLGDDAASATDAMSLLRAEVRRTTTHLGFLTTAFDNANAAMDRRDSMRGYQEALKAFIADPSAETRDAAVSAAMDMANSFDDPTKRAKVTAGAVGEITDAAKKAGVSVPTDLVKIGTAAGNALDPVASLKREMELIPPEIITNIRVKTTYSYVGTPPPGGYPTGNGATNGSAYGGYVGGHGGSRADDVPAMLSSGEFVIQAPAVSQFGRGLFAALNQGVNPLAGMGTSSAGGGSGLTINGGITVQSASGERADQSLPRALRRMAFLAGA